MQIRKERKDAVEHRALILKTAQCLFKEHGLDEVSMHQIAKSAGVGQGTLYRRYANKNDLCLDLMQDSCRRFDDKLALDLKMGRDLPLEEQICIVLDNWMDFIEEKLEWLGAIQASKNCEPNKVYYYQSPPYLLMHGTLNRLLTEHAAFHARPDFNTDFTAHVLLASWDPNLYGMFRKDNGYSPEQIKINFRQLVLRSLTY